MAGGGLKGVKLFVGCLPYSKQEADLKPIFEQFGTVEEVALLRKPDGTSKGAAFITFQVPEAASTALEYLQNYTFAGTNRGINISWATSAGPGMNPANQTVRPSSAPSASPQSWPSGPSQAWPSGPSQAWPSGPSQAWPSGPSQMQPPAPSMQQPQPWGPPQSWAGAYAQQHLPQFPNQPPPPRAPFPPSLGASLGAAAAPGTKVFVGQLPYSKEESDLWQLFGAIGPVLEVVLMRDSKTRQKKGAAFVRFQAAAHAEHAVGALDGFTFVGSPRPITVSLAANEGGQKRNRDASAALRIQSMGTQADGALPIGGNSPVAPVAREEVEGAKLFVGQLPFSRNEEEIKKVFSTYGPVAEVFLHRDSAGQKKGGAFVRYFTVHDAFKAMELDGYMFQGATRPITVALAGDGAKKRKVE